MQGMRVAVQPEVLRWACERAGFTPERAPEALPMLGAWLSGQKQPTIKQLEGFAKKTHTPVGYFFLDTPPADVVPIPDFRTVRGKQIGRPSANLLDTIYACQERQAWFREHLQRSGGQPASFVGEFTVRTGVMRAADEMRARLGFELAARKNDKTWEDALRRFIAQAEALGVLVMVNGVVGSNTHRKLNPEEFRGFALADALAPLVFINGADSKSAQMFTLAHELAHIWLGKSALSDVGPDAAPAHGVETWCNQVAAELLVPMKDFLAQHDPKRLLVEELQRLARIYKVSTLVVLRRVLDAGRISRRAFHLAYEAELARIKRAKGSGGDFYATTNARVGKRFLRAVIADTLEGETLFTDAFRLMGFSSQKAFDRLAVDLGVR